MQSPFAKWLIKAGPQKEIRMYQKAAERKVKLFSTAEIARMQGLEKIRWKFWNEKAEELCRGNELKNWKPIAIHGIIYTAWTLKKTAVLVVEANNVWEEDLAAETLDTSKKQQKAETVDENVKRTLNSPLSAIKY